MPAVIASPRARALALCALLVAVLYAVAALAPLPYTIMQPGITADTLGRYRGVQVIEISGRPVRQTTGQLRMTTIAATPPGERISLLHALAAWPDPDRAVVPSEAVYPAGRSVEQVDRQNTAEMRQSQDAATAAALHHLGLRPDQVKVTLHLADVGGPSAGLLFTLGIIDKLAGDGTGGDLTGGRVIAGTGTIDAAGRVGPVGGVALKTQAAARDGATVFLVPRAECSEAQVNTPRGLRLIPVDTLDGTLAALSALRGGGRLPTC
ncbi:S16 family serine protease [Streptacidiphilus griseoplanus]|uniref:S16 family serine protease n=1 Tax=Peterkaempfera griseoplana TaxID=66896 RepID=UPI000A7F7826|nr:S16 family serine protease [Peterkaempfera griseoplana]